MLSRGEGCMSLAREKGSAKQRTEEGEDSGGCHAKAWGMGRSQPFISVWAHKQLGEEA